MTLTAQIAMIRENIDLFMFFDGTSSNHEERVLSRRHSNASFSRHVPEALRRADETPEPDDDPTRE